MPKWLRISIVAAMATLGCAAQTATDLESAAVNRVAVRMSCPCGCKMNMACRMEPYPCQVCNAHKIKIFNMQARGMSDDAILASFANTEGADILATPPGFFGSISSYAALFVGLLLVIFVIRKYRRKQPEAAGRAADENLARYHDQIEKDLAKLD